MRLPDPSEAEIMADLAALEVKGSGSSRVGRGGRGRLSVPHGWSFQGDAVGVVDEAIEDGVGEGGLSDHVVPVLDEELTGHEGSLLTVAVVEEDLARPAGPHRNPPPLRRADSHPPDRIVEAVPARPPEGAWLKRLKGLSRRRSRPLPGPAHAPGAAAVSPRGRLLDTLQD